MDVEHPVRAQVSLALPPIDRLPSADTEPNLLAEFVRKRTQRWGGVPVPLTSPVVGALWAVLLLNIVLGGYLLGVRAGVAPCSGVVCTALTFGDHPQLALLLTELSAGALAVSVPMTRGLSVAGGPQLGLMVVGAVAGVVALLGPVVLLVATALCLAVAVGVLVFVADRL